jgi:hypothetical protein
MRSGSAFAAAALTLAAPRRHPSPQVSPAYLAAKRHAEEARLMQEEAAEARTAFCAQVRVLLESR